MNKSVASADYRAEMAKPLFDTLAVARNRARALKGGAPAMFLHEAVRDEVKERLTEVNKSFAKVAIVTPFPDIWQMEFPGAMFVQPGDVLNLAEDSHDLVIHGLAMHWQNDPVGQMIQCRKALVPDGVFIAALLGGQTLSELRSVLAEAESTIRSGISPRVAPMAELRELGGLLMRAGFAQPVADSAVLKVTYSDMLALLRDLRAMGETNAVSARSRGMMRRDVLALADALYQRHFAPGSRLNATFETIYLTGWEVSENQQKPLRPGSATMRLADALNVDEIEIGEKAGVMKAGTE